MRRKDRAPRRTAGDAPPPGPRRPRPGAPRPLTQRGRTTRDKLLRAAREVFGRESFGDVRITDITTQAGVASGTFYTYFDSKQEIFREVAAGVLEEMSVAPRLSPGEAELRPIQQIELSTRRYFESVRRNARIARSIEEVQAREQGVGRARRDVLVLGVKRIERWIRRLQQQGVCDREIEPWPTALALHAMNVSVAYDHLVHRDAPEETEVLLAAVLRIWRAALGLPG